LERRALFDVTAFYIDWTDIQVIAARGGLTFLTNAGKAASQGVELSTAFKLTERLRLGLNGAYTDATLSKDLPLIPSTSPLSGECKGNPPAPVGSFRGGCKDDRLPFTPELSWSATAEYSFPLGSDWNGQVGGGFRWVDERESGLTNTNPLVFPAPTLDSYNALDLNAALSNDHWTLRAYGKNVTDERAYLTIGAAQSQVTGMTGRLIAASVLPRTWGIGVDYRF
ncbi:MAG: TonB-dependent receptor domain-containing protein, partial [Steroidobacteraceae bacterium]